MIANGRNLVPLMTYGYIPNVVLLSVLPITKLRLLTAGASILQLTQMKSGDSLGGKKSKGVASELPSESDWINYFTSEFSPPSKKFSRGYDQLCGFHLLHASDKLLQHLHLFYQIIFYSGIVPNSFCVGTLTPVPKKDKDSRQCCSYRPITVSSVLCKLLELRVIMDINKACSTPDNQFGFKEGYSREHVHYILANVLMDIENSGEFLVLAAHDVSRAFDSSVHSHLLIVRSSDVSIVQLCVYLKICVRDYVLS